MATDARSSEIQILTPDGDLGTTLLPVARQIFADTFQGFFPPDDLKSFCDVAYASDGPMARDLKSSEVHWQVAAISGEPIGYAKLTPVRAPVENVPERSLELQQIYVLRSWHGQGVAQQLMDWAVTTAIKWEAHDLYLTVFDHNVRAKRFYSRNGFAKVALCTFQLGGREYEDQIWHRNLERV